MTVRVLLLLSNRLFDVRNASKVNNSGKSRRWEEQTKCKLKSILSHVHPSAGNDLNFHSHELNTLSDVNVKQIQQFVEITSPLLEITCHMESHSVTCHPAAVTSPPLPQLKLVLDLATLEGCKAELTFEATYPGLVRHIKCLITPKLLQLLVPIQIDGQAESTLWLPRWFSQSQCDCSVC